MLFAPMCPTPTPFKSLEGKRGKNGREEKRGEERRGEETGREGGQEKEKERKKEERKKERRRKRREVKKGRGIDGRDKRREKR